MSEDLSVLLSGSGAPSAQLKSLLETQGIFGDPVSRGEFENMLRLADPALVIHFGKEGAHETVRVLQQTTATERVHLVVIANRSDLPELRKLDHSIVSSLLAADMPDSVLSARITMLARKKRTSGPHSETLVAADPPHRPGESSTAEVNELQNTSLPMDPTIDVETATPEPEPFQQNTMSHQTALITKKAALPSNPRIIVADSDVMRGDAIARTLRQSGLVTLLVPLDPARTKWPLVQQFSPDLLVVDSVALKTEGQIWHQLLLADQGLSGIRIAALLFDRLFDENTGAVNLRPLALHLPQLSHAPHREPLATLVDPSAELADLDPALIDELPEAERPTLFNDVAPAVGGESDKAPLTKDDVAPIAPRSPIASPYHPSFESIAPRSKTPKLVAIAVAALLLAILGGIILKTLNSNQRDRAAAARAKAAALVPKEVILESGSKESAEIISPWVVEDTSQVKGCEELIQNLAELKKLGADQGNISWANARKALVLGNLEEAHQYLCEASLLHPDGLAVEGLVELLLSKHAASKAQTWMTKALAARPERRKTLDLQGDLLSQLGKADDAKATWAQALKIDIKDEKSLASFGTHYDQEGENFIHNENWAKAELMFRRAATLNPKSASAAAHLGHTFLRQGYLELANVWAEKSIELQPEFGPALVIKADIAFEKKDLAAALPLYKQALKTDPGNARAHQQVHLMTRSK